VGEQRFQHEVAWYDYWYAKRYNMVAICTKYLEPCKIIYLSREEVEKRIQAQKWNPFLLPIYEEALKHFPKEANHVIR